MSANRVGSTLPSTGSASSTAQGPGMPVDVPLTTTSSPSESQHETRTTAASACTSTRRHSTATTAAAASSSGMPKKELSSVRFIDSAAEAHGSAPMLRVARPQSWARSFPPGGCQMSP